MRYLILFYWGYLTAGIGVDAWVWWLGKYRPLVPEISREFSFTAGMQLHYLEIEETDSQFNSRLAKEIQYLESSTNFLRQITQCVNGAIDAIEHIQKNGKPQNHR